MPALADVQAMHDLVRQVEAGEPVEQHLRRLVAPGATLGGARPKALLTMDGALWVVKFGETGDPLDSPLIEHATMTARPPAQASTSAKRGQSSCRPGTRWPCGASTRVGERIARLVSARCAAAAGETSGYPELALLLRRRADADAFAAQGEQLFRRMVFNILIDNTDDHEQNHALLVGGAQRYRLSPAFDVLPSGQALGYQQMRVGRDGAESTLDNALSECRAFALTPQRAREVCADVAGAVSGWRSHFKTLGVGANDIAMLGEQIDRTFLREQRERFS